MKTCGGETRLMVGLVALLVLANTKSLLDRVSTTSRVDAQPSGDWPHRWRTHPLPRGGTDPVQVRVL